MPVDAPTPATIAKRLRNDNRPLVTSLDPAATGTLKGKNIALFSGRLPDGAKIGVVGPTGTVTPTGTAAETNDATIANRTAAFVANQDPAAAVGARVNPDITGTLSPYVRRQLFSVWNPLTGSMTTKWCYTDQYGTPLKADGTPINTRNVSTGAITRGSVLTDAADANAVPLSAVGSAVANHAQPGPMVGFYGAYTQQQGFSPYPGWTAQQLRI